MGSPNEFRWLSTENVTFLWQATEISNEIPLRLRLALLRRYSLHRSSTPLRMTYRGFIWWFVLEKRVKCESPLLFVIPSKSFSRAQIQENKANSSHIRRNNTQSLALRCQDKR